MIGTGIGKTSRASDVTTVQRLATLATSRDEGELMASRRAWVWMISLMLSLAVMVPQGQGGTRQPSPRHGQIGLASWYGPGLQGRKTASGERLARHRLTAAHRSLPFGTKVLVTNLQTQAQVEVKITDRGPRQKRRLIDLSYAAADRLGLLSRGLGRVHVVVSEPALTQPIPEDEILHVVQIRTFAALEEAKALRARLHSQYPRTYAIAHQGPTGRYYRVRIGPFHTAQRAQQVAHALQRQGHYVFVDQVTRRTLQARGVPLPDPDNSRTRLDPPG